MRIGLLGLQGAFLDHIPHLKRCGVDHTVVRDVKGLKQIDRLIIPGGESTVMAMFLNEFGMRTPLQERIAAGMPTWGVCAGAILLSATVDGTPGPLNALPISVTRNAYGRQINSSQRWIALPSFDIDSYPAIFIRAPRIESIEAGVTTYATYHGDPVFVQKGRIMATTFHPELNKEDLFHHYFLSI
jgi:pyridoxal 5'-phosphate synthase pdxT subunit